MTKSYVTITVCPICGEDNGTLLLDKRLRDKFEMHTVDPRNPCDKCREKYLKEAVLLINPKTGSLAVLKDEPFLQMTGWDSVPEKRVVFTDEKVVQHLIKMKEEIENEQ